MRFRSIIAAAVICTVSPLAQTVYGQSEDDLARAGCPHLIAPWARPGYGSKYLVYYVGGGSKTFYRSEGRRADEGTFGVDYMPIVPGFRHSVALGWWHGRRYQGGAGEYEPNKIVPIFPNAPRHWRDSDFPFD